MPLEDENATLQRTKQPGRSGGASRPSETMGLLPKERTHRQVALRSLLDEGTEISTVDDFVTVGASRFNANQ